MRQYGPVTTAGGSGAPVKVEYRRLPNSQTWTDVTTQFTIAVPGNGSRDVTITPSGGGEFIGGREYRVTYGAPDPAVLCDQVVGTPPVHNDTGNPYNFFVPISMARMQSADKDSDGVLDWSDAAAWEDSPIDLDGDGKATEADWEALVAIIEDGGKY